MKERRKERIEKLLQERLSEFVQQEFPQLLDKFITVSRVELSGDGRSARVFITSMQETDLCVEELNRRAGYLRKLLAEKVNLRYTPSLKFLKDEEAERLRRIEELFERVKDEE